MALKSPAQSKASSSEQKDEERDWPDFVCGAGSAVANILITFPVYKVMFRQQVEGIRLRYAVRQIAREGLSNLFRGVGPPLMQKGTSLAIMFGAYNKFQKDLSRNFLVFHPGVTSAIAAMLAGSIEALLTPFERVQTLLQDRAHNKVLTNAFHAFRVIQDQYGFREYYRGLTPILMRNGPSNVLFFGLRVPIKDALPEAKTELGNSINDFVSGAVLGAGLSTLFYPVNVMKNQMQKQLGGEFVGFWRTCVIVFDSRGRSIRRLYYGLTLNYTRALVSWGIINCTYELLKKTINQIQDS